MHFILCLGGPICRAVAYDVYFFESFLAVLEDDVEMSLLLMCNKFKERMEFLLVSNFPQLVFAVFNQKLNGSQCNYKDLIKVQKWNKSS